MILHIEYVFFLIAHKRNNKQINSKKKEIQLSLNLLLKRI